MSSNGVAVLLQVRRQGNLPVAAVIHNTRHPSRAPVVHLVNGRRHARYHPCVLKRRDPSSSDKWRGSSQGALADPTKRAARLAPRSVWRPSRGIARLAPVRVRGAALPLVDPRARRGGCPGRYRLVVDHAGRTFRLLGAGGGELQSGNVGDPVGGALGMRWAPNASMLPQGSKVAFRLRALRDAAKGLGSSLSVTMDPSGNFLRIGLTEEDPTRAALTVNAVAQRFVEVSAELKRAKLHTLGTLLDEQLRAARENLRRAESALEQFRVRTATLAPDPGAGSASSSGNASSLALLGPRLEQEQLRRDRSAIEQVLVQIRDSGGSPDGLALIGAAQRSPDVSQALRDLSAKRAERRALDSRYTADHPAVRRLTGEIEVLERTTIPALARSLRDDLTQRERVLAPQIAVGDAELRGIPQRVIDEARLRRDVDLATNLFTGVQQRYDEARLADASTVADVRILDAAVAPQEPLKNSTSRFIIFGFAAGLGL